MHCQKFRPFDPKMKDHIFRVKVFDSKNHCRFKIHFRVRTSKLNFNIKFSTQRFRLITAITGFCHTTLNHSVALCHAGY